MDDLYTDYDPSSTSGRLDKSFIADPLRRISLPLPDDLKMALPPGVPKYDPSAMPHSIFHEFQLRLTYVPPLSYYALHALQPYYTCISPLDEPLSSQVSVSGERVSIVDCLLPHAKHHIEYVDPATWAILIQVYDSLPERFSRFTLALNDPHLSVLANIPSTPNFSIVTVLDLSGCSELLDGNVSFLKVLTSLCVLDTSRTKLTDRGVKNFKSTLFLREPGPAYLRSWSLRMCEGVTAGVLGAFRAFPLLCVLGERHLLLATSRNLTREDLRGTSVPPLQAETLWPQSTRLPTLDNTEYFIPNPQYKIPELLQQLSGSSFSHSQSGSSTKSPYLIHIDRVRPEILVRHRPSRERGISRIGKNAYHVDALYVDPSERGTRYQPDHTPRPSYQDDYVDYGEYGSSEFDWPSDDMLSEGERSDDSESIQAESDGISDQDSGSMASSRQSTSRTRDLDPSSRMPQGVVPSPPTRASSFPSSSNPPFGFPLTVNTIPDRLASGPFDPSSAPQAGGLTLGSGSVPQSGVSPAKFDQSAVSGNGPDDSTFEDILQHEDKAASQAIPGFFNSRAQAGIAPPKRRRVKRYPSESSRSYDSEEERKRRRIEFSDFGNVKLALLRKPPPWSTAQKLIDAKRKVAVTEGPASQGEGASNAGVQPLTQLAKAKKVQTNGALAAWNLILASSSKKPTPLPSSSGLQATGIDNSQSSTSAIQSRSTHVKDKPAKRTTIGILLKDRGPISRKLKYERP